MFTKVTIKITRNPKYVGRVYLLQCEKYPVAWCTKVTRTTTGLPFRRNTLLKEEMFFEVMNQVCIETGVYDSDFDDYWRPIKSFDTENEARMFSNSLKQLDEINETIDCQLAQNNV